jgi:hypothetical protein
MQNMADGCTLAERFSRNMANGYTLADRLARTWLMDIFTQDMANGYTLVTNRFWPEHDRRLYDVPYQADFIQDMANGLP